MTTTATAAYWEPLWAGGRRYRQLDGPENRLMDEYLGPGRGRPALDIGCGDGTLARHLHHELGYRTTGIDISPSAVALAAAHDEGPAPGPAWRCADITTSDFTGLPEPVYAVITCRLVYRWMDDKAAFLNRVRHLLVPGGTFWVVTEIAGRREDTDPLQGLGISPAETETLTSGWSAVQTADLDVLRCYALHPCPLTPTHPLPMEDSVTTEKDTVEIWNTYGTHQITRGLQLPELDRWDWGIPETGPGINALGEVAGLRVLDLGSGLGRHAANLAALGAKVTAVDASPAQHQRALTRYPDHPCLHLVCVDAVAHLRAADPYDLIYSVCSVPYLDPNRLLPALANGLKPSGRLVFSALHTNSDGAGPSNEVTPRPEILRLPGTTQDHPVNMWVLSVQLWEDLLVQHGLTLESVTAIDSPTTDNAVSYRLYTARRPVRVPSRPRTNAPPPPNTALGVGVIVYGPDGILLGRHRRRTWELASGTVEPGETFAEAAVRELREEAGLVAEPDDVQVLGTLLDRVGDVVRLTVPVLITRWSGTPHQREEAIGSWRFWPLTALPQPLFVPSAQCLTAWNPALPLDHPRAHFQPYASPGR